MINFVGVITAADNIKYPAINAFVRVFQQDQGRCKSNQESWSEITLKNHYAGKNFELLSFNFWLDSVKLKIVSYITTRPKFICITILFRFEKAMCSNSNINLSIS